MACSIYTWSQLRENEIMNFERLETEFIGTYGLICNYSQSPISFFPKGLKEPRRSNESDGCPAERQQYSGIKKESLSTLQIPLR
jgi:hypothetical protein